MAPARARAAAPATRAVLEDDELDPTYVIAVGLQVSVIHH
jgi:hypothetical protein